MISLPTCNGGNLQSKNQLLHCQLKNKKHKLPEWFVTNGSTTQLMAEKLILAFWGDKCYKSICTSSMEDSSFIVGVPGNGFSYFSLVSIGTIMVTWNEIFILLGRVAFKAVLLLAFTVQKNSGSISRRVKDKKIDQGQRRRTGTSPCPCCPSCALHIYDAMPTCPEVRLGQK